MNKQINELNEEQAERIGEIRDRWIAYGLCVEPCDREAAADAMRLTYKLGGIESVPTIHWVDSPQEALNLGHELSGIPKLQLTFGYGGQDSWFAFYDFFEPYLECVGQLRGLLALGREAHWWLALEEDAIMVDRPEIIARDEEGRLHSLEGPAMRYRNGEAYYFIHGIAVSPMIVENPEKITDAMIDGEENAEVRRVMIDRYGLERYMEKSQVVGEDEFGILLRKDLDGDEPIVVVKVTNSTPEPDGTYKTYFLRVPPDMKTPHEAVAWTFGHLPTDYRPLLET